MYIILRLGRRDVTGYMYMNITLFLFAALISYPLCGIHCGVDSTRSLASYSSNILLSLSVSVREETGIRYFPREALRFTY